VPDKRLSYLILGGLIVGLGTGLAVKALGLPTQALLSGARFVGELFIRGLFMLILPLVVPMVITGIHKLTETEALGKIGLHAVLAILGLTAVAATLGLTTVLVIQPGQNFPASTLARLTASEHSPAKPPLSWSQILLSLLPKNPLHEMAMVFTSSQAGGLISVVSFSILFGIAMARLSAEVSQPLYRALEALFQASQWLLWRILWWLGPIGVASLTFSAALSLGPDIFSLFGQYVGVVVLGLGIQMFVVYPIFLYFLARRSPWRTFSLSAPALLMAFSSASSNATLPVTLRVATERLGVAPAIARFITTLGATINQNGTALYEGVTILFLMQVYGQSPSFSEGVLVVFMAMLIAIGAAGVPGGSLPLLAGLLPTFGVPASAIWLIYGVDRILDMMRTTLNVYGDLVIASYLHRIYAGTHDSRSAT